MITPAGGGVKWSPAPGTRWAADPVMESDRPSSDLTDRASPDHAVRHSGSPFIIVGGGVIIRCITGRFDDDRGYQLPVGAPFGDVIREIDP